MAFTYIFSFVAAWQCDFFALSNMLQQHRFSSNSNISTCNVTVYTLVSRNNNDAQRERENDESAGMLSYGSFSFK